MARGHRLNTSIVLAAVHGLLGLPGRCAQSSLPSLAPSPPHPSPSLISVLASVDVKQNINGYNFLLIKPLRLIVQELCESRGGRPELSVLTSLLVSVDVKNY